MMKPFWPQWKVPEEGGSNMPIGSSNSLTLTAANVSQSAIEGTVGAPQYLCGVERADAVPFVLTIGTHLLAGSLQGIQGVDAVELQAGQDGNSQSPSIANGWVEVVYGQGSTTQRVVMDLRPGTYQLPPCNQVRVYAQGWYNAGTGSFKPDGVRVEAALAPGIFPNPSEPTFTMLFPLNGSDTETGLIPNKARRVDCWAYTTGLGAGKPVLTLYGGDNGFPSLTRDYTSGVWAPPYPAPCFGGTQETQFNFFSTVAANCWVQFGLEF